MDGEGGRMLLLLCRGQERNHVLMGLTPHLFPPSSVPKHLKCIKGGSSVELFPSPMLGRKQRRGGGESHPPLDIAPRGVPSKVQTFCARRSKNITKKRIFRLNFIFIFSFSSKIFPASWCVDKREGEVHNNGGGNPTKPKKKSHVINWTAAYL